MCKSGYVNQDPFIRIRSLKAGSMCMLASEDALLELDALDQGAADGVLCEGALHLGHDRREEVVRDDKDCETPC